MWNTGMGWVGPRYQNGCRLCSGMQKTVTVFGVSIELEVMRISNPSLLFQSYPLARFLCSHHSSTNLFVAGLSYDTNETVLRNAFEQHGEIIEVRVICDHVTGKSKGYGFVRFSSESEAATSRKEMHRQILDGRRIRVSYAHKA